MALDKTNTIVAYRLGRLFAALEKTQEDAMGGDLNVTIKDRYFSSASANPVTAFPRLLRLHAHHLDKLGADKRGFKIAREKLIQEICEGIDSQKGFPARLPLDEQGLFFIGYYHQRQDFFTSKKTEFETTGSASPKSSVIFDVVSTGLISAESAQRFRATRGSGRFAAHRFCVIHRHLGRIFSKGLHQPERPYSGAGSSA
jgi:hypothetical protein